MPLWPPLPGTDWAEYYKKWEKPEDGKYDYTVNLYASAYHGDSYSRPRCTYETNKKLDVSRVGIAVSAVGFTALVLPAVWFLSAKRCYRSTSLGGLFKWMHVAFLFAMGTFAFSFMMWQGILNGTTDEEFYIMSVKKLDAIYIALPFVLALWRQAI